jgi:predicted Fe-Mo cluster-binding NifX family protein
MMETIAITYWNGIVSPLFDAAATVLIVGPDRAKQQVSLREASIYARAELLQQHTVQVVICGAISTPALAALQERGMRVTPWIRGPVNDVLLAYNNGSLETGAFFMPGCRRNGMQCGNAHGGRRRRQCGRQKVCAAQGK